jgi:hypothetical protein
MPDKKGVYVLRLTLALPLHCLDRKPTSSRL